MIIGNLNRRIEIFNELTQANSVGQQVKTRELFKRSWAAVDYQASDEPGTDEIKGTRQKLKITIRHLPGLNETQTIDYNGQTWEIISIKPIGRNEAQEIKAQIIK